MLAQSEGSCSRQGQGWQRGVPPAWATSALRAVVRAHASVQLWAAYALRVCCAILASESDTNSCTGLSLPCSFILVCSVIAREIAGSTKLYNPLSHILRRGRGEEEVIVTAQQQVHTRCFKVCACCKQLAVTGWYHWIMSTVHNHDPSTALARCA